MITSGGWYYLLEINLKYKLLQASLVYICRVSVLGIPEEGIWGLRTTTHLDNQGRISVSTDPEGTVSASPDPSGTGPVSPDPEGTGAVSTDPEGTGSVSPDPEGAGSVSSYGDTYRFQPLRV